MAVVAVVVLVVVVVVVVVDKFVVVYGYAPYFVRHCTVDVLWFVVVVAVVGADTKLVVLWHPVQQWESVVSFWGLFLLRIFQARDVFWST